MGQQNTCFDRKNWCSFKSIICSVMNRGRPLSFWGLREMSASVAIIPSNVIMESTNLLLSSSQWQEGKLCFLLLL